MKKLSITHLETARKNPAAFAATLTGAAGGSSFGKSKYADWKNAIYFFHKGNNVADTLDYFEEFFFKHFKSNSVNSRDFERYTTAIESYIAEFTSNKYVFIEAKKKIDFELSKDKLSLSGQVPLVNMNRNLGYSIYFFAKTSNNWQSELRFPIVQYYFAEHVYDVPLSEVGVGIFSLDDCRYHEKIYSSTEVASARKELQSMSSQIATFL